MHQTLPGSFRSICLISSPVGPPLQPSPRKPPPHESFFLIGFTL